MKEFISAEDLERFDRDFHANRANVCAMNAVTANGVAAAAKRWRAPAGAVHQYSIRLDQHGVTNQKSSGCGWMYAALNCLRFQVVKRFNLDYLELSQNYTLFYDKLEKANYFLENILATLDEAMDSRLLMHLLGSPEQDGGQWDLISAIIFKYGVVPREAMPESACSSDTKDMNAVLAEKLRGDAAELRAAAKSGSNDVALRNMKKQMLCDVYRILCICLGTPPERFDFKIWTKDGRYISDCGLTPKKFFDKYVSLDLSQYISLINAPMDGKQYMRSYTVKFLGNVMDGTPLRYVNVPIESLKAAAIAQLKDGEPVWFGCDAGMQSDRAGGMMDPDIYDFGTLFHTEFTMDKADRLEYGHSQMTHAMLFQGVDLDSNETPVRWCVENSRGDECGNNGMYLMTDRWFDEYMYQVVVNKKYLPQEILGAYEMDPIELSPWDPMGSLT